MGSLDDEKTTVHIVCHDVATSSSLGCDNAAIDVGDVVKVRVCHPMRSLSGVLGRFLNDRDLHSVVEMRLEQRPAFAANWDGVAPCPAA